MLLAQSLCFMVPLKLGCEILFKCVSRIANILTSTRQPAISNQSGKKLVLVAFFSLPGLVGFQNRK